MISSFLAMIMTFGLTDEYLKVNPLNGWRKKCKNVLRFLGRAIAFCFGFHKIKKNGVRVPRSEVIRILFIIIANLKIQKNIKGHYFRSCSAFIILGCICIFYSWSSKWCFQN